MGQTANCCQADSYDEATCAKFVSGLGDEVLARAFVLFSLLAARCSVDSLTLADAIGVAPHAISGHLTTPLKRRARMLELPLPFLGGKGARPYSGLPGPVEGMVKGRTHWQDHAGIASRMLAVIEAEQIARRQHATESMMFAGELMHLPNRALTPTSSNAAACGPDSEIWVYANSFQGYTVLGDEPLWHLRKLAVARWEATRELPRSLTLLRAVLFAEARVEKFTDYGPSDWTEHRAYMRLLALGIAARVAEGAIEDEYLTAVRWLHGSQTELDCTWEPVADTAFQSAVAAVTAKGDLMIDPTTVAANVRLLNELEEFERHSNDERV